MTAKETSMGRRSVSLIILDGYGINENSTGNAVAQAKKPNIDRLLASCPNTRIKTSGLDVGLPEGQMGNSEVGHTNIGAGRIVYQELTRITGAIKDGSFFDEPELCAAMQNCLDKESSLQIMGLLSDGGVHSHNTHLYALLEMAKRMGLKNVFIHCFFDGRDVPPDSALKFVMELEDKIKEIGTGRIASIMGRYYAMDRDNRWDRVKLAYDALAGGDGAKSDNAAEAVKVSYAEGIFDEFVKPVVITEKGKPVSMISENDSVIFFNFRPDRAREITRVFTQKDFDAFNRKYFDTFFVCMTQYDATFTNVHTAYKPQCLDNTFGEYISRKGLTQLRIAETEKYAHVTFFFNGGTEAAYENEDRVLIPSPKVPTYDMRPEMSAYEVTDEAVKRIRSGKYDVIILNFANADMVGHTGILEAAVKAIEAVDACLGRIVDAVIEQNSMALVTSDHGNSEQLMDYESGGVFTAHTTNDVPLILVGRNDVGLKQGRLADIAPTMLELLGLKKPDEMTGGSLLIPV
jgi:2,3-bisphosphoglycerate-independent phosphoglycerate mutase